MTLAVHLSDLHYGEGSPWQPGIFEGLVETLASLRTRPGLLLLSGDVFDTATPPPGHLDGFLALLDRMDAALGGFVPTLVLPGNHDRRTDGVFAPWTGDLFRELARRLERHPHVRVAGLKVPFLAEVVPLPGFPADVVAYDSTWLPRGLLSAGGVVRREDLVRIASQLGPADGSKPLLFVLHHHLVPTPVTDTSPIETAGRPLLQRVLVEEVLPDLVANGDREELTMTALGAGTALSSLAQLDRAVVVLHGHKHYPVARLLAGPDAGAADVLLASAGSCGTATAIMGAELDEEPHLWPSLNLVRLEAGAVQVETLAWSPWEPGRRNAPRPLVRARREGVRWVLERDARARPAFEPVQARNVADVTLKTSRTHDDRLDVEVRRTLESLPVARAKVWPELVSGPPDARLVEVRLGGLPQDDQPAPARLELPLTGEASWTVLGGAVAHVRGADAAWGPGAAYDSVSLLNRSRCAHVELSVSLGPVRTEPFASATDLTSGVERPVPLVREGGRVRVVLERCPARTLVRVHWPLEIE